MKYLIVVIISCMMSVAFSMSAEAQLINRLKKKAQDAAERKAEQKLTEQVEQMASQMVEKSWSSIFGEIDADSISGTKFPFIANSSVKTEDTYNFDTITTMEIETLRNDGKSEPPVIMEMHFNENEMYTGTKFNSEELQKDGSDLFIIYDFKNSAMLMLMSKDQDKFSFAYDWKQALENAEEVSEDRSDEDINWDEVEEWQGYKKIESKNILGYDCDGYRSENENQVIDIWVSRHADVGMYNLFKANANSKQMKGKLPADYPQGMMMEMVAKDLESGDKTIMKVTDIKKNTRISYAMADYPSMSFSPKTNK